MIQKRGWGGPGPESNPNFVPNHFVAEMNSCDIRLMLSTLGFRSTHRKPTLEIADPVLGRFNRSELILNRLNFCIIVVSNPGVSFLFPERGSRLPALTGLVPTRSREFPQLSLRRVSTVSRASAPEPLSTRLVWIKRWLRAYWLTLVVVFFSTLMDNVHVPSIHVQRLLQFHSLP